MKTLRLVLLVLFLVVIPHVRALIPRHDLALVLDMAHTLLLSGFNAGTNYPQVWIRDTNTFIDVIMDILPQENVSLALIRFLEFQHANGEISDGYALSPNGTGLFKNNDETDQEALAKYINRYQDFDLLDQIINNKTLTDRVDDAFGFLFNERFSAKYGLIWGGTTVDWGDCQPEGTNQTTVVNLTSLSHPAIDIYDNSMFVIALRMWADVLVASGKHKSHAEKYYAFANQTAANILTHLWDSDRLKWRPHIYLAKGSPFQNVSNFDEDDIFYFGGTAVSAQAGLLSQDQILISLDRMRLLAAKAGPNVTIGLTNYPVYPNDSVHNAAISEWNYQNGGDWPWFGGRWIQVLISLNLIAEAEECLAPMISAVLQYNGFYEWFDRTGKPNGSPAFHGAAGVLGQAIKMLTAAKKRQQLQQQAPPLY